MTPAENIDAGLAHAHDTYGPSSITVSQDANDKKSGMTLDEIGTFLSQAIRLDIDGDTRVNVTAGFRSQIQKLEVKS